MAKALVLGATGHIGAHLVRVLLKEGHAVRAAYRSERFLHLLDGLEVERIRLDLEDLFGFEKAAEECHWIFHAAGYYPRFTDDRDESVRHGIETTRRFFEAVRRCTAQRVVFTSSAATIRRVAGRAADEKDAESWPLDHWRPVYASVKVAMEQEALRAASEGMPVVIVNPALCIGEYDAHPFSGKALLAFAKRPMPFYISYSFNVVYTGDVGVGHVRAAEKGKVGERYLLACRNMTLKDFAALCARTAGVRPPWIRLPYPAALATAVATEFVAALTGREPVLPREAVRNGRFKQELDGSKAVRELGMPQTPVEEAVARAVSWFKQNGYLR
ncbi:MAG: NAD-dependent epimerase/dehydratase family protein [Candidatus Omnitrophica bacterium]|nr:NAD-dependent epimerase/dehydratase family protein [Candidatus Omnitrophota bacterium]